MTRVETAALDLLFQRLTWPSGLVRERTCASLGLLLADAELGQEVADETLRWMENQALESTQVLGLLAIADAQIHGASMPTWATISRSISKPSLLSWLIARHLFGTQVDDPDVAIWHSGSKPEEFDADAFFLKYAENFLPPVYMERAKRIDRERCTGFVAHWAFEWSTIVAATETPLRGPYVSFWTNPLDDHLMCLDLTLSEVYRSAYLRSLAWAVDIRGVSPSTALWFAMQTCPIDLALWQVRPGKSPDYWPALVRASGEVDTLPGLVTGELASMWQRQVRDDDWAIAKASGRVYEDADVAYDIEIVGVIQACAGPEGPEIQALFTDDERRVIEWRERHLLVYGGSYSRVEPSRWREKQADWVVWRLAAIADPNTVPRWQWWRCWRRLWLPSPFLAEEAFDFRCTEGGITVEERGCEVARWRDWTHQLREMTTANLSPSTGQMLLIRRSVVEREAARLGGVFAWVCEITAYSRKYKHGEFSVTRFALDFGTTKIVRDGDSND